MKALGPVQLSQVPPKIGMSRGISSGFYIHIYIYRDYIDIHRLYR